MPSIQHILCPVDFSETSDHAIAHALRIADWYGARITALHVVSPRTVPAYDVTPAYIGIPITDDERHALEAQVKERFHDGPRGVAVQPVIDEGLPVSVILDHASRETDLVVMGTHGTSGFDRLVLGSVAEKVLRKARCPVLTVPPRAQLTSQLPYKRILASVDFSDSSLLGVEYALSLAEESDASLTLMHVIEWPWEEPPPPALDEIPPVYAATLGEFRQHREADARRRLEGLVPADARTWCTVHTRVAHGKPWVELLRAASEGVCDLIVIGVHGRPALEVTVFGSTTQQIARRATCPVLTIRHP
jgi:nucleotide-binding universal stress UspA family protein